MADVRAYYKTDVGYFDNPKIAPLVEDHPRSVVLHQRAIAYCAQHLTDGQFPIRLVARLACASYCGSHCDGQCDFCLLAQCGLVVSLAGGRAELHDYLEHNRSAADAKRLKNAGQKGAAARWTKTSDANGNAKANGQRERKRDSGSAPRKRGHRIDPDFAVTDDMTAWAKSNGLDHLNLEAVTEEFVDYWLGATKNAAKVDWVATWRNWVRRQAERAPRAAKGGRAGDVDYDAWDRHNAAMKAKGLA